MHRESGTDRAWRHKELYLLTAKQNSLDQLFAEKASPKPYFEFIEYLMHTSHIHSTCHYICLFSYRRYHIVPVNTLLVVAALGQVTSQKKSSLTIWNFNHLLLCDLGKTRLFQLEWHLIFTSLLSFWWVWLSPGAK